MRIRLLLTLGIFAMGACPVMAQPKPATRYVPFPFDANAEAVVQDRLARLKKAEQAQSFIEKLLSDPNQFRLNEEMVDKLKKLKLDDPLVQERLKPWLEKGPPGKSSLPPVDLDKFKDLVEQVAEAQESPLLAPPPPVGFSSGSITTNRPGDAPKAPDAEAGVRDWLKGAMERAEESDVGKWLRESPAFQKALHDLHGSVRMPDLQPDRWGLERLFKLDKLSMPDAAALERLGQFKPKLPHINAPALPSLSRPSLPPVSAPSVPTIWSLGTVATWLLCFALVALLVWQASRWIGLPGRAARGADAVLGPWPVQPTAVCTRTELVQAFDYLALLLVGNKARTMHHRAAAMEMGQRAACAGPAVDLAALYERARYTEGPESLADNDRDRARAALVRLAGGTP